MSADFTANSYRWPLITLDFEASALARHSYPIEIGLCVWEAPGQPAYSWSSLIKPTPAWLNSGQWSEASEAIHGIPLSSLQDAPEAGLVMRQANAFAKVGAIAQCDGGAWDAYWLDRLEKAAEAHATFQLGSWQLVQHAMPTALTQVIQSFCESDKIVHRAGPDAEMHVLAFAQALDLSLPEIIRV